MSVKRFYTEVHSFVGEHCFSAFGEAIFCTKSRPRCCVIRESVTKCFGIVLLRVVSESRSLWTVLPLNQPCPCGLHLGKYRSLSRRWLLQKHQSAIVLCYSSAVNSPLPCRQAYWQYSLLCTNFLACLAPRTSTFPLNQYCPTNRKYEHLTCTAEFRKQLFSPGSLRRPLVQAIEAVLESLSPRSIVVFKTSSDIPH